MLPGDEEVVRAWYHKSLPGGMAGDWRKGAVRLEKDPHSSPERITEARRLRQCAELYIQDRLHITNTGQPSDYKNCVWCGTGSSAGA